MTPKRPKTRPPLSRIIATLGTDPSLSASDFAVMVVIASHAGAFGRPCYPGLTLIAKLAHLTRTNASNAVQRCEAKGWLVVARPRAGGPHQSSRYTPTRPPFVQAALDQEQRERAARREVREHKAALDAENRRAQIEHDCAQSDDWQEERET